MKSALLHVAIATLICVCADGQSQYKVLYSFGTNGPNDAREPNQGFAYHGGVLYGTTVIGGNNCPQFGGCGTVFAMEEFFGTTAEAVLYSFCTTGDPTTCPDGAFPNGGLISDSKGDLYGTTPWGGSAACPMGRSKHVARSSN